MQKKLLILLLPVVALLLAEAFRRYRNRPKDPLPSKKPVPTVPTKPTLPTRPDLASA